jgi:L-gulonate 3-dehydrogenase
MGMRYAFMGPMETIHLNADGTQNYCDRYGHVSPGLSGARQMMTTFQTIYDVSSDLGPIPTGWK